MQDSKKTLGIIHASNLTIRAMQPFLERYIPDIEDPGRNGHGTERLRDGSEKQLDPSR